MENFLALSVEGLAVGEAMTQMTVSQVLSVYFLCVIWHFSPFILPATDYQAPLQFVACGEGMEMEKYIFTLQRTHGVRSFVTQKELDVILMPVYL